jgi:diaminopimelate epimerase
MTIEFYKYQATGNDFVLVDNRDGKISLSVEQVKSICDRKFGIGADGLMLIESNADSDFSLVYYNSDGSQSLCGNGSRAAVLFASSLGVINGETTFEAYDGPHQAKLTIGQKVRLKMNDVTEVRKLENDFFIHTGSPHYIRVVKDIEQFPVFDEGRKIRYADTFQPGGTNVNFIQLLDNNQIYVRTYERGVENETLSCGTGVTAAALAASFFGYVSPVGIRTLGGELSVEFSTTPHSDSPGQAAIFTDIHLIGPAKMVFKGELEL